MKKQILYLAATLLTAIIMTSCSKDYFDQESYQAIVKKTFPVENVDPQHTWATIGSAELTVNVDEGQNEWFAVRVYDKNPIGNQGTLSLLGSGVVANGHTFKTTVNYPLMQNYVYVALINKHNYLTVYPAGIENGQASVNVGSGSTAAASRAMRTIASDFAFAPAPATSDFKREIPADALLASQYGNDTKDSFHNYKLAETSDVQAVNFYAGNFALYVSGTKNIRYTNPGDGMRDMVFYILPGANLTFKESAFTQKGAGIFAMYVAEGATVTFEKGLQSYMYLYNRGTVNVTGDCYKPGIYDGGVFYNEGTFNITNASSYYTEGYNISNPLTLNNHTSQFINAGRLNCGGVVIEGSAHFLNLDTVYVSDATIVNSNNCTWVNNGYYKTGNFKYTAGSTDVKNNCHLIVDNEFFIGLGDTDRNSFQLDGAASVVTKYFKFAGPGFIRMGAASLFHVTDKAYFAINKDIYGIYGPAEGDYAVFQAKAIERLYSWETNQGFAANYFNRLYVATDSHFPFGYSDKTQQQQAQGEVGAQPYYRLDAPSGARMTNYNGADVHVSDNGCGSAYSGQPQQQEPQAQSFSLRYCFEDNFPEVGDYDFNDVVITLTPTISGRTVTLRVSLDAVGAMEQVGAAIRIAGLTNAEVASINREGNLDANFPSVCTHILPSSDIQLSDDQKYNTNDIVLPLFSNAHWAMNPVFANDGSVLNWFYNTVARNNDYAAKQNDMSPKVLTYTFQLNSDEAAAKFSQANLDVFIVESYNGGFWEVHTTPFKTTEVIRQYASGDKSAYSDNFPWAVCVPGNDFKYPVEWQPIGARSGNVISGAYQTMGHSFAEWAENRNAATDWYLYPTAVLVYE
jgi:LruC domain-containing protein